MTLPRRKPPPVRKGKGLPPFIFKILPREEITLPIVGVVSILQGGMRVGPFEHSWKKSGI